MSRYDKYVNALFLVAAVIVWFISKHYVETLIGNFQLYRRWGSGASIMEHGLPMLLGVVTFVALRLTRASYDFSAESISELTKVSWPTSKEVQLGTTVVIITVLLAGLILGGIDILLVKIVQSIISV
jgi:preprotein translocase SecE subunit